MDGEPKNVHGSSLRAYLNDVRGGLPVTREMACRLIRCGDDELPELLAAAVHLKEQFKPGVISYSRKVFLPLTNLCRDYCGYCIFRRDPGQPGAHTMTPEEVLQVAREGERLGCREALFSLGDKPEQAFPEMRATAAEQRPAAGLQHEADARRHHAQAPQPRGAHQPRVSVRDQRGLAQHQVAHGFQIMQR